MGRRCDVTGGTAHNFLDRLQFDAMSVTREIASSRDLCLSLLRHRRSCADPRLGALAGMPHYQKTSNARSSRAFG